MCIIGIALSVLPRGRYATHQSPRHTPTRFYKIQRYIFMTIPHLCFSVALLPPAYLTVANALLCVTFLVLFYLSVGADIFPDRLASQ